MNNIALFQQDGIDLVINTINGECFYPGYRSLARICSIGLKEPIDPTRVRRTVESVLKGVTDSGLEEAEILTPGGLQGVTLIPRKIGTKVIKKYNELLYEEMAEAGHIVFLHKLVGYEVKLSAVQLQHQQQAEAPKYLPPLEQAEKAISVAERYKAVFGTINPQVESHLKDLIANVLIETNKLFTGSTETWMGVVNFAEVELGYSVPKKGGFRDSALGMWIRFYHPELSERQERRFCNETQREIWVYPIHQVRKELTKAVHEFFNDPNPGEKLRLEGAYKKKSSTRES